MTSAYDESVRGQREVLPSGAIARIGTLQWSTAGRAKCIAFSADAQTIACAPNTGVFHDAIQLWDVPTGEIQQVLRGHADLITRVRFSRDGTRLFSSCCDETVRCWDVASGEELQRFHFKDAVFAFDITSDEELMAVCVGKEVYLRDATRRKHMVRIASDKFEVKDIRFSRDDKWLAAPTPFGSVTIWDVATRNQTLKLDADRSYFSNIDFSADGKLLCAGQGINDAFVWGVNLEGTVPTGRELWRKPDGQALAFSPIEPLLAMNHGWIGIALFDAESGELKRDLIGHADRVESFDFSLDGTTLASGAQDGTIRLWDVATAKQVYNHVGHQHSVEALEFSPDGELLVTGSADKSIRVWSTQHHRQLRTLDGHVGRINDLTVSPAGDLIASVDDWYKPAVVRVWELRSGRVWSEFPGGNNRFASVNFSSDGRLLVAGSHDKCLRIWDVASGEQIRMIRTGDNLEDSIHSTAISPNGNYLACGMNNERVHVYDANTSKLLHVLKGHEGRVGSVLFLPDGQRLASASTDDTAIIWDLRNGKAEHILRGHDLWVTSIVCLADGKTLATSSLDTTIRLWDLATGRALRVIHAHRGGIKALSASKCGRYLASGSEDTTVLLWDAQRLIRDREKQED